MRAVAHSRIVDLRMRDGEGDQALRHSAAALQALKGVGDRSVVLQLQWVMALASLQVGAIDEAERWSERSALSRADAAPGTVTFDLELRAEIALARGEVDTGLRLWRQAVGRLRRPDGPYAGQPGMEPWILEIQAVAVIAHAQHGRLDLVEEVARELPRAASTMLMNPVARPPAAFVGFPLWGALLLAVALVDLERGERADGARMIALAERFRFLRQFQPTMCAARARTAAEQADRSAYDDAVSTYADLGHDDLRGTALAALAARDRR